MLLLGRLVKGRRKRWCLLIFSSVAVCLLALAAICYFLPRQFLVVDSGAIKADAIIVLGGGLKERGYRAAQLFRTGEAPLIICTGAGDIGANEACLTNSGVPLADIQLEPLANSTRENALFTIPLLRARHCHSAIIVTSWYHSRRALHCFEHYAPGIKFYSRPSYDDYLPTDSTDSHRKHTNHHNINAHIKLEYVKLLGYWVRYGVCPL